MLHLAMWSWPVVLALVLPAVSANVCLPPSGDDLRYAYLVGRRQGDYQKIACDAGGTKYLYCLSTGRWRHDDGRCPRPTCPEPPLPPDGMSQMTSTGSYLDDVVTYTCKAGMEGGPIVLQCRVRRKRSNPTFFWKPLNRTSAGIKIRTIQCRVPDGEVRCPPFEDSSYRIVDDSNSDLMYAHPVYAPDDMVAFACEPGYTLRGEEDLYCDEGTWDFDPPICRSAICNLPIRDHMTVSRNSRRFTGGESVVLGCEEGYDLVPYHAQILKCNGQRRSGWDKKVPTCKAIRCPAIGYIEGGSPSVRHIGDGQWGIGSRVTMRCDDGYQLVGSPKRTCTDAGSWDGNLQVCDRGDSTCGNPGEPISGRKEGNNYNVGDVVEFRCNTGFSMLGSPNRTCLPKGVWSGPQTRCMGPREYMTMTEAQIKLEDGLMQLSGKTRDSELERNKTNDLMGKDLLYGEHDMKGINPNARSTIGDLMQKAGGLDFYAVLDTSGSIPVQDRLKSIEIIRTIASKLGISDSAEGTGIGFVAYNDKAWKRLGVGELTTMEAVNIYLDEVANEATGKGGTAPAIAFAALNSLLPAAPHRKKSIAIVMLTDGLKNVGGDPAVEIEKIVKDRSLYGQDVHVYCLGVGEADVAELQRIASKGEEYVVKVKRWDVLNLAAKIMFNNTEFEKCGRAGHVVPYVGDAENNFAEPDSWRWMGGLYRYNMDDHLSEKDQFLNEKNEFICGVSLLGLGDGVKESRWVLTAAHCVYEYPEQGYKFLVKFGSLYRHKTLDDSPVIVRVKSKMHVHKDFYSHTYANDIALLELTASIPFSLNIRPICLPENNARDLYRPPTLATVTGWGYWNLTLFRKKEKTNILKNLVVQIRDNNTCELSTNAIQQRFNYSYNFCAGGIIRSDGQVLDACKTDSGGPLMVSHRDNIGRIIWDQIGIVSFGDGCGQATKPGIYTKVSSFLTWISTKLNL